MKTAHLRQNIANIASNENFLASSAKLAVESTPTIRVVTKAINDSVIKPPATAIRSRKAQHKVTEIG